MGHERSEVKVEGQKKNYLKIGVRRKQQVLLQGQPRSLVISIISNNNSNMMAEKRNYQDLANTYILRMPKI